MVPLHNHNPWGVPPWQIDFTPPPVPLPGAADFAVIGAGFSGLATAAWLRLLAPEKSVVVLEAGRIGHGASGRTGGMALDGAAADDLSALDDVLGGLRKILARLEVECDLSLPGAWEVARRGGTKGSPIAWNDSGALHVVNEVRGGTLDPGKLVSGLARAADRLGAIIAENHPVEHMEWRDGAEIRFAGGRLRARRVLFATNALSLRLSALEESSTPKLTLATLTAPLSSTQLEEIGLAERKPFYTVDLPYLWGRVCSDNSLLLGAGLLDAPDSDDLEDVDIAAPEATRMFASFERRVHGLHPALKECRFTHRWGGPILFREGWRPVFAEHPSSANGIVLGAYAGHGVALSSFLGAWAAEALLGERSLPQWGALLARRGSS
ncbi:MAG TPA: FAD-binding oxidoreductase [Candidatus Acidoferrales bacterium]|jgi:glycine/D-amino acid oxidase-like deaminating enzyme|nr:FAD-binding oxidoreductase [Candidatus Acidoferrales bacterium]